MSTSAATSATTTTYTVTGMTCGHCVSSVTAEVGKVPGVTGVQVDLASGRVTVAADRARDALTRCGPEDDYPSALFLLGWTEVRLRRDLREAIALLRSAADEARLHDRDETFRLAVFLWTMPFCAERAMTGSAAASAA